MDYGKFKYEAAQKAKEARRNQANTILKEVRFRLKIDTHDYTTKLKRAEGFLNQGDKVKAMILFRGREQSRPEQGVRLLQKFAEDVAEFGTVESNPTIDGRNMVMVIAPLKNKAEARAEAQAKRVSKAEAREQARTEAVEQAKTAQEATVEAIVEAVQIVETAPVVEAAPAAEAKPAKPAAEKKPAAAKPAAKPATKAPAKPAAAKTAAKPATAKPAAPKTTTAKKPAAKKAAE